MTAYYGGDLHRSQAVLNRTIIKEMPAGDYRESSDATWLLLDRATTQFAAGDAKGAISDYQQAIEAFDFYRETLAAEIAAKVLLQDEIGAYQGEDFEHILARFYLALALIQEGDMGNAQAILRQAEELQQKKREDYSSHPITRDYILIDNAAAKYLFALLLEHRGDNSNARILYKEAASLADTPQGSLKAGEATLLTVCHNGNVPYKISTITPASVASTVALEILLAMHDVDPAISCITGIPTPAFAYRKGSVPRPTALSVDGVRCVLCPVYDVARTAEQQLNQKIPFIVARGVARYLLRRGATAYVDRHNEGLGALCDFALCIANLHTKADTRSWLTLPARIELGRQAVSAGVHRVSVEMGNGRHEDHMIVLQPGDLCVINIFNIHPGVATVLIPKHYKKENTDEQ